MIYSSAAFAAPSPSNWELAYKDSNTAFYFDTNSVRTVGSDDVITAELKTEMSPDMVKLLIEKCKDQYDTSNWTEIKYMVSSTKYNQKDRTLLTKNHRCYDVNHNLLGTITDEDKSTVPAGSVQSKIYDTIFDWLYAN
ncbi:MAG: hypothetical protein WCS30_00955 [Selenomonadaceae bacterium]